MTEHDQLLAAIAQLETQRAVLGDVAVDTAIAALRGRIETAPALRKQVTVLFADLCDVPGLAGQLDPEEMAALLQRYFDTIAPILRSFGGIVEDFVGDAVMALFGSAAAQENDPENAVRAALALQQALDELNLQLAREDRPRLAARVGIHTGPVLLTPLPRGRHGQNYDASGETVNLASRIETAAQPGAILISHDTYRHVRGIFSVRALDPLGVKGRSDLLQVYVVRAAKPRAFRMATRGVEGIETRMIGRSAELECLQERLKLARDTRRTQVALITGEAGIGKSRLLDEFTHWLELLSERYWLFAARAEPQAEGRPYALMRDLFAYRFEIHDSDPPPVARQKLVDGIGAFLGPERAETAHYIGHLIGLDFSASLHLAGILDDTRQIRHLAFRGAVQFLEAVAAQGPAVLFAEDIQWADDGSLDFLDYVTQQCPALPLLVVCLARPSLFDRRPGWARPSPERTRLDLLPLSSTDSARLVDEILRKATSVPAELRERIAAQAEGNPFYVEELIKVLVEDGVIIPGTNEWHVAAGALAEAHVPPTLRGVLQARLDVLPPAERAVLQQAAVIGRVFWASAVTRLGRIDRTAEADTAAALDGLVARELILEHPDSAFAGDREYAFKHTLLHDVTYDGVLKRRRPTYHAEAARWLVARSGERTAEYAGVIAGHYERAGEMPAAAEWHGRAGRQALETYAPAVAVACYRKALDFLPAGDAFARQRAMLCAGLGEALYVQALYAEAAEAYLAMRSAATAGGDGRSVARAWNSLCQVRDRQGDHQSALEAAARAEEAARAGNQQAELATALTRKGQALWRLGRPQEAQPVAEQALDLSRRMGARDLMALSLNLLGSINDSLGRYVQAGAYRARSLALYRELGNRNRVAGMLNNIGEGARSRGDYAGAILLYLEALQIAREIGDRSIELYLLSNMGGARVGLGDYAAAEADLRQCLALAADSGWVGLAETYSFLAEACLAQRKFAEALAAAQEALARAQAHDEAELVGTAWRVLGRAAAARPEAGRDPRACFAESERVFAAINAESGRALTLHAWAEYERAGGNLPRAESLAREAESLFARLGMRGS